MAADPDQQRHRPGTLKQQNKAHKHGRHRSKGKLEKDTKGRVSVKVLSKKSRHVQKRNDRRNQAHQIRKQRRDEALAKKRSRGGQGTPPYLVAVLPLCDGLDTTSLVNLMKSCDDSLTVIENDQGLIHISIPRFKQRLTLCVTRYGDTVSVLDAAKVADSVLCLLSPEEGMDDQGDDTLKCLLSQGLPAVNFVVQGFKEIPVKKQGDVRKFLQRQIESKFPGEKFHSLDDKQDALLVLRQLTNQKLRQILYRERRPHMITEEIQFELDNAECETGTLKVCGYLRGRSLSVNGLVHLPGWGDFQMSQIDAPKDPYPLVLGQDKQRRKNSEGDNTSSVEMEEEDEKVLARADPNRQESLQSEVVPDPMEGEQTWPTPEEMADAEVAAESKAKVVKKVPKGTSDYQASWIINSDEEEEQSEDDSEEEEDVAMEAEEEDASEDGSDVETEEQEDYDTVSLTDDTSRYDAGMDLDEDRRTLEKIKEEKAHVTFPDEIDTPMETTARARFARYRGLKSFRTSPWDPKENLPHDYARIFQFADFKRTKKRVLAEEGDGAMPGWFITVHIVDVPKAFMECYQPGIPVVLFGLLPHEQKISVVNFVIRRIPGESPTIKSKERLTFHVGYRRFTACPIFSQHTNGTKHKFERFLPHEGTSVATIYAPIMFAPAPVLVFKENHFNVPELIASGSILSINPDRIVAKRIVLSGHPFKIHKRSAIVRYMFFNREDVLWFKPVELRTKWGRRGHIKDPLGTHGHMRCSFDGKLKSQDTVLLTLYKRMYPKWTYNSHVPHPPIRAEDRDTMETEEGQAYQMFTD
ncbi:pre-rRNA-processing protein TSR1 homolog [Liolophura sinensis]|uniref:pre-rRNA-processing protein TSR1 homolog n=1 Tax=Liolophura sinensis TaxID=3198878 RepID=UPI003159181C